MNEQAINLCSVFSEIGRAVKEVVRLFVDLVTTIANALETKAKKNEEKAQRNMRNGWGLFSARTYKDAFVWVKRKIKRTLKLE